MKTQLFFTLMYFCLELEASDLSRPKLMMDAALITATDSVTLKCQNPSGVSASACAFFIQNELLLVGHCLQKATGSELLNLTKRRSPATFEVRCLYRVKSGALNLTSPESDASTIEINNLLPPVLSVNPLLISDTDSVTLNCQTPVSVTECYWHFKGKNRANRFSCSRTLTGAELSAMTSQRVPAKVKVSCSYLHGHDSPKSEPKIITIQFPQPELRVNPAVITERDSATLNCVTRSSLSVTECHFHFLRTKMTKSGSCMQMLTAAELLSMSSQRTPAEVELTCHYSVEQQERNSLSPHSNISYIYIEKASTTTQQTSPYRATSVLSTTIKDTILPSTTVSSASSTRRSFQTSQTSVTPQPVTHSTTASLLTPYVLSVTQTTKIQEKSEKRKLKLYIVLVGPTFGVTVGIILLGVTLLCSKRRQYTTRRHKVSNANFMEIRNIHSEGQETPEFTAGRYDETTVFSMNNILPAVNCPAEFEQKNDQQSQNESSGVYHVYATIAEEEPAPALTDETYYKLQPH